MGSASLHPGDGQDDTALLLTVAWTECAISSVFIIFRFYCRKKITKNLWWDDWFILTTFILAILSSSLFTGYASNGGAKHIFDVRPTQMPQILMFNYISQGSCMLALSTGKVSVALLIYRLQAPSKWRTWLLALLSVSSFVIALLVIALFLAQCSSLKGLWTPGTGPCWNPKVVNDVLISAYGYWALVDFLLALLPPTFLWNLQMNIKRKVVLSVLLGLGIFASVCAAFKAYYLSTLIGEADSTWFSVQLLIWNINEVSAIIYAACIPTAMPIFTRFYQKINSRAPFKARDPEANAPAGARRLGSTDNHPLRPKRIPSKIPLGSGTIGNDGHSGEAQMLDADFIERLGEVQTISGKKGTVSDPGHGVKLEGD